MILAFFYGTALLLGCFPTAYWAGRHFGGLDIRKHGSGNVGATNALRVLGKKVGIAVFAVDILKGALPVIVFFFFARRAGLPYEPHGLWIGLAAVCGHVFNPFLGFKGGKGVATSAGVLLVNYPVLFAYAVAVFLAIFVCTRIVSLGSLASGLVLVAAAWRTGRSRQELASLAVLLFLIVWTHRENIGRLLTGTEKKIS